MSRNNEGDSPSVLESQFILRLPQEPARELRRALVNNSNLRDRISIKIEADMRQGEVRVDHWLLTAKVLDLPTIVESMKTIDGKGFYKTADICQMVVCKEEDEHTVDEDSPQKSSRKVDKKYLHPHGITPPMKNVRKRRFRKTLKKKYVEAPEIEKEVKRLFREDNESVTGVKWEVMNEDDSIRMNKGSVVKREPLEHGAEHRLDIEAGVAVNVDDSICKIFGGAVSDSEDEEDGEVHIKFDRSEMDDNSQNSADDSHLTDSNSVMNHMAPDTKILTEFSSDMFTESQTSPTILHNIEFYNNSSLSSIPYSTQNLSRPAVESRLEELQGELEQLKIRCQQHDIDIENSDNLNLRQRLQNIRDRCLHEQMQKEQELIELQELIKE